MNFWSLLPQPIIGLAPMDGVTDATFRRIVAAQGRPDITFTEFTNVHDVCRGPEFLLSTLIYSEQERPVVAQLYGKDPALFYIAAHAVCELGFDGLDINMGCPSRNVAASGAGAGLIRTPELAHDIMRAAKQGIDDWAAGQSPEAAGFKPARAEVLRAMNRQRGSADVPVRRRIPLSIKTRLGYDSVVIEDWVAHLLKEEPVAISIHGRTLEQMYRGEADWSAIARAARIARGTGTLILGNGDVHCWRDIARRVRECEVQGVLVGRGVLGSPWFFRAKKRVRQVIRTDGVGEQAEAELVEEQVSLRERMNVMLEHARQFELLCGQEQFRRMRKHLGWYCKGFPYAAALRARMFQVSSAAEVTEMIEESWPSMSGEARAALSCEPTISAPVLS